jgi:hypothetical protein
MHGAGHLDINLPSAGAGVVAGGSIPGGMQADLGIPGRWGFGHKDHDTCGLSDRRASANKKWPGKLLTNRGRILTTAPRLRLGGGSRGYLNRGLCREPMPQHAANMRSSTTGALI